MKALLLWIAQGFGIGRIPFAPGTFGSLIGLLWFALLLRTGHLWLFLGGTLLGLALSVWLCGAGEKILRKTDPGSIVFDEIAAIPVCFLGWVALVVSKTGSMPMWNYFLSSHIWPLTVGVFVAFRFFDVLKPWPVRQSQALYGGWGVTVDDALAAGYVNIVVFAAYFGQAMLTR